MSLLALCGAFPGAVSAADSGTFAPLPSRLTTPREGALAVPLPDGDVLLAGGDSAAWGCRINCPPSSAELFDPVTRTFATLPEPMTPARYDAAAAPLPNGNVLIAGGYNGTSGVLATAEEFDPLTRAFVALPNPMTIPRQGAVAAPLPNGEVLIAGGENAIGQPLSSAELFDPSTATFSPSPGWMSTVREGAVAAPLPDGDVLIAGGRGNGGSFLASAEVFQHSTGRFAQLAQSMTTVRHAAVAAPLPDGNVLIAGGINNSGRLLAGAEVFHPATHAFTAVPAASASARNGAAAAPLPNGDVLIAGGRSGSGDLSSAALFRSAPAPILKHHHRLDLVICGPAQERPAGSAPQDHNAMAGCTHRLVRRVFGLRTVEYALLRRGRRVYATGRPGNGDVLLRARRRLTSGRFILALKHLSDGLWTTSLYGIRVS